MDYKLIFRHLNFKTSPLQMAELTEHSPAASAATIPTGNLTLAHILQSYSFSFLPFAL